MISKGGINGNVRKVIGIDNSIRKPKVMAEEIAAVLKSERPPSGHRWYPGAITRKDS